MISCHMIQSWLNDHNRMCICGSIAYGVTQQLLGREMDMVGAQMTDCGRMQQIYSYRPKIN